MLRTVLASAAALVAFALAILALLAADRWAFKRRHGQPALDAFDAECSRIDQQLDGLAPAVVIPIHTGHKRLVECPPRGAA